MQYIVDTSSPALLLSLRRGKKTANWDMCQLHLPGYQRVDHPHAKEYHHEDHTYPAMVGAA